MTKKDRQIENICTGPPLRQTPVAGDLRFVSAALKIVSDMERIGDQAADIAELSPVYIRKTASGKGPYIRYLLCCHEYGDGQCRSPCKKG